MRLSHESQCNHLTRATRERNGRFAAQPNAKEAFCPYTTDLHRTRVRVGGPTAAGQQLLGRLREHADARRWRPPYSEARVPAWLRSALVGNRSSATALELLRFSYHTCSGGRCEPSFVPEALYEDNWVAAKARALLAARQREHAGRPLPFFLQVRLGCV